MLEALGSNIKDTTRRKLQFELVQLKDLESKRDLSESADEVVVIESNDGAIKILKNRIKGMKNELNILREKERILVRDLELMSKSLQVVEKVPDQAVQGLQFEIEELGKGIRISFQDETEDEFNQIFLH